MENYQLYEALLSQLLVADSEREFRMLWTALLALKLTSDRIEAIRLHAKNLPTLKNTLNGSRLNLACKHFLLVTKDFPFTLTVIQDDINNPEFDHDSQIVTRLISEAIESTSDILFAVAFRTKDLQNKLMEWIQIRDTDGTLESMVFNKLKSPDSMLILNQVEQST